MNKTIAAALIMFLVTGSTLFAGVQGQRPQRFNLGGKTFSTPQLSVQFSGDVGCAKCVFKKSKSCQLMVKVTNKKNVRFIPCKSNKLALKTLEGVKESETQGVLSGRLISSPIPEVRPLLLKLRSGSINRQQLLTQMRVLREKNKDLEKTLVLEKVKLEEKKENKEDKVK